MISYIIIGRNEGWKLDLCFKSVIETIRENTFIGGEIIYVDSDSTDNSIEVAKKYHGIKVLKLTGDCNAPSARNAGAERSNGEILFFIDGDMEIESSFLKQVINRNNSLCYGFVGGYYVNKIYNDKWEYVSSDQFPLPVRLKHDYFEASTGGLFMITRDNWDLIGGMKSYFFGGEDPDLAFRLARLGIYKLRKTDLMAVHHTQQPGRSARLNSLFSRRALTGRILLYRENLRSAPALKRMFRNEYSAFFLVVSIIAMCISLVAGVILLFLYLLITTGRYVRRKNNPLWTLILKDLIFLIGFLVYWPTKQINVSAEEV